MNAPLTTPEHGRLKAVLWPLQPHDDESLLGLVARVAEHNVLESAHSIMSQVGQRYPHRTIGAISDEISIDKLAVVLKLDLEAIRLRSYVSSETNEDDILFFGARLRPSDIETRHRRFSPGSLARLPYHRALWDCRLIPMCIDSWEVLIDACHQCGARQRWHSAIGIVFCDVCNGDLTLAPAIKVPAEMRPTLAVVAGLLNPIAEARNVAMAALPSSLHGLSRGSIINLLAELLHVVDPTSPHRRTKCGWHKDPERFVTALHKAGDMMLGWPSRFLDHVRSSFSGKAKGPRDGSLRSCSDFIKRITNHGSDQQLADRMQELFGPMRTTSSADDNLPPGNISIKDTAKCIGRGAGIMAEARRQKLLRTTISIRSGQLVQSFDTAEIERLTAFIKDRVGPEALGGRLGISYHGVEQIVCMGLLEPASHPFIKGMYEGPQFTGTSIHAFVTKLQSQAVPSDELVEPTLLINVLRSVGGRLRDWGPIVWAMIEGDLSFAIAAEGPSFMSRIVVNFAARTEIAELRFERDDYRDFAFEPFMSKVDAAASLNVSAPKADFLDGHRVGISRGRSHRTLPMEVVERLARDYISAQEVLARAGIQHWVFAKMMERAGSPKTHALGWDRIAAEKVIGQLAA